MILLLLFCLFAGPLEKRQTNSPISPNNPCYSYYQQGYQYGFYDGYWYGMYYYTSSSGSGITSTNTVGTTAGLGTTGSVGGTVPVVGAASINGSPVLPASGASGSSPIPGLPVVDGKTDFSRFPTYFGSPPSAQHTYATETVAAAASTAASS